MKDVPPGRDCFRLESAPHNLKRDEDGCCVRGSLGAVAGQRRHHVRRRVRRIEPHVRVTLLLFAVSPAFAQLRHAAAEVAAHSGRLPQKSPDESEEVIPRRLRRSRSHQRERVPRGVVRLGMFDPREIDPGDVAKVAKYPVIRVGRDETRGEYVGRDDGSDGFSGSFGPHPKEPGRQDTRRGLKHSMRSAVAHGFEVHGEADLGKPRVAGHEAVRPHEAVLLARGKYHDESAARGRFSAFLARVRAEQRVGVGDDVSDELDGHRSARRVVRTPRRDVNGVDVDAHEQRGSLPLLAISWERVIAPPDAYREGWEVFVHHELLVPRISADVQRKLAAVRVLDDVDFELVVAVVPHVRSRRLDRPQLLADEIERPCLRVGARGSRSSRFHVARELQSSSFGEDRRRRILVDEGRFRQDSEDSGERRWEGGGAHLGDRGRQAPVEIPSRRARQGNQRPRDDHAVGIVHGAPDCGAVRFGVPPARVSHQPWSATWYRPKRSDC